MDAGGAVAYRIQRQAIQQKAQNKIMDATDFLIIHDGCGLPVELCECPDAEVRYDPVMDMFVEQTISKGGSDE
jgi:hypothetical protein